MNTKPVVSRFADRATLTVQPNTLAKAEEEADSFKFFCISRGHYACESGDTTYIIIDRGGKIGCSCDDMTYRCTGNTVCKHIATFLKLDSPPQIPASGELTKKLMLMGWVGGKDDLHPAELLKPVQNTPSELVTPIFTVMCPHCNTRAKRETQEEADAWLGKHVLGCLKNPANEEPKAPPGRKATVSKMETVEPSPKLPDPLHEPEDPGYPEQCIPEMPDPPSDDFSNCANCDPILPSKPPAPPLSPDTVPPNLATALCNMQKVDLLAVTDSDNPFFNNAKYADLASVWAAIRKPLTDNGLAVIQTTEQYPAGVTVVTTLVHVSGETFTSRLSCEVPQSKPDKNGQIKPNVQGLGSTIIYLRRYSLAAMVGVAPIDDDGEEAMSR